jgi:hypothetical protein
MIVKISIKSIELEVYGLFRIDWVANTRSGWTDRAV